MRQIKQGLMLLEGQCAADAIAAVCLLPTFDLSPQMARVSKENPSWDQHRLDKAEHDYRLFLQMCQADPGTSQRPSVDADLVWHAHIVHTRQYIQNCKSYLGRFLHHTPDSGSSDAQDVGLCVPSQDIDLGFENQEVMH